jgi:hypothetical protein
MHLDKMSVAELVSYLKAIEASDEIESVPEDDVLNFGYITDRHLLVQNAVYVADQVLLQPGGQRNYLNEIELRKQGYYISCLEKDGVGWLSGGIYTMKGVIAYG